MLQALSYISSSAENLYKFLFINGTVLVILSMFYPLQQKNEIKIRTIDFNKNVDILNYKIELHKAYVIKFKKNSKKLIVFLDSISRRRTPKNICVIEKTKIKYNQELDSINSIQQNIELNQIKLEAEKNKIEELKKQAEIYSDYSFYFLIAGILFCVIGVLGWGARTRTLDKIRSKELKKISIQVKEMEKHKDK